MTNKTNSSNQITFGTLILLWFGSLGLSAAFATFSFYSIGQFDPIAGWSLAALFPASIIINTYKKTLPDLVMPAKWFGLLLIFAFVASMIRPDGPIGQGMVAQTSALNQNAGIDKVRLGLDRMISRMPEILGWIAVLLVLFTCIKPFRTRASGQSGPAAKRPPVIS